MWIFDKELYIQDMKEIGGNIYDWADIVEGKEIDFLNEDSSTGTYRGLFMISKQWCRKVKKRNDESKNKRV